SSLETDCVGIGDGNAEVSAGNNCLSSSGSSQPIAPSFGKPSHICYPAATWDRVPQELHILCQQRLPGRCPGPATRRAPMAQRALADAPPCAFDECLVIRTGHACPVPSSGGTRGRPTSPELSKQAPGYPTGCCAPRGGPIMASKDLAKASNASLR